MYRSAMTETTDIRNQLNLNDYSVIEIIGTGSFGTCYKVQHKKTNKYYVWKAVDYGSMNLQKKQLLVTEVNLMSTLKHPHIVQYYGRIIHKNSGTLYIIMEWCEKGDLNTLIKKCKSKNIALDEKFIWKVLYQTAKALETCHSLLKQVTVLHRDIKPANIFLDKDYNIKLGDFGLAKILERNVNFSSTLVGTPYYMSPEQIHGSKYNKKSDIWSLGCLIYELCSLTQPFSVNDLIKLRDDDVKNRLSRVPSIYSDYLDKMVKLMLNSSHEFRPSVEVIVHHPTVICNYEATAKPFNVKSHIGDGDVVYQTNSYHTDVSKSDSRERIDMAAEENAYCRQLLNQMKILKKKETMLRVKEDSLRSMEQELRTKENSLENKQKEIEKREREISVLRRTATIKKEFNYSRSKSTDRTRENRRSKIDAHLDSTTYSADPGDTSVMPTTVKLDPDKIVKPTHFMKKYSKITHSKEMILSENTAKCENKHSRQPFLLVQNAALLNMKNKLFRKEISKSNL